jgi:Methyltransferase FkbM domain
VPSITLDSGAEQEGMARIDALWLDMLGHEFAVLKAAPRVLRTVSVIHTEVHLMDLYEGAPLYPEVRAWLEGQVFRVVHEALPCKDAGNVLFARAC